MVRLVAVEESDRGGGCSMDGKASGVLGGELKVGERDGDREMNERERERGRVYNVYVRKKKRGECSVHNQTFIHQRERKRERERERYI